MNSTLNVIDGVFGAAETISEIDYVSVGRKVINGVVIVTAVIVALCTYAWTALQLFWDCHGEKIKMAATRFAFNTVDFAGNCMLAGREFRGFVNVTVAQITDRAFYLAACC